MSCWVRTVWITGPPDEVRRAKPGHLEQLRELEAQGRLRLAGEIGDGEGLLEIFEASDRVEAEAVARASPLVEGGLGSWMLRPWKDAGL